MSQNDNTLLIHPTGNANVRAAIESLYKENMLHSFHTSIAIFPGDYLYKLAKIPLLKDLYRRQFSHEIKSKTYTYPFREVGRLAASKTGFDFLTKAEVGFFSIDVVYRKLDKQVCKFISRQDKNLPINIYAYDDGALQAFQMAKAKGIGCIYDLPTIYWRRKEKYINEIKKKKPQWISTVQGSKDSREKLLKKDREIGLADHIIVASSSTANSLEDYPGNLPPIHIIPYGFPPVAVEKNYTLPKNKLKVLFVGRLTEAKGIAEIFEAVRHLKDKVELTLVGKKNSEHCEVLNENMSDHHWIPSLPHNEILNLMKDHDVLLFPSHYEGFGLVITEAMSQGTPVITTDRTVGLDLITNGKNGWIISAGSSESLIKKLNEILNDPSCIESVGKEAMETAKKRPWSAYRDEFSNTLKMIIENNDH